MDKVEGSDPSPEQKKVGEWLNEKGYFKPCAVCGAEKFRADTVPTGYIAFTGSQTWRHMLFPVVCTNCANIRFVDAGVANLMSDAPETPNAY
jgi:hypothetical protein